jgi:hypothetical protein
VKRTVMLYIENRMSVENLIEDIEKITGLPVKKEVTGNELQENVIKERYIYILDDIKNLIFFTLSERKPVYAKITINMDILLKNYNMVMAIWNPIDAKVDNSSTLIDFARSLFEGLKQTKRYGLFLNLDYDITIDYTKPFTVPNEVFDRYDPFTETDSEPE